MPDDTMLLRRYAIDRDEAAFGELVRRHVDSVYSAALRRVGGDAHLAQDVAQQVFVALAAKAEAVARHATLTGWLYTATRHAAANVVRSERRRKRREQEAYTMHDSFSPANDADWNRVAPVLDEAIDQLPEKDRTALLARFIDRRAFGEIGATLRISEDAARMRVERALDRLRALLARRGIESTAAALSLTLTNHAVAAAPAALATTVTASALTASGGVSGVGATLGVLEFMSTTKLGVAGFVALVVMTGVAIHQQQARKAADQALGVARTERAAQMAALRADDARAKEIEKETAQLQKAADETRAAVPAPAPPWDPTQEGRAFLERNSEVKRALANYVNASLRFHYAPMYRALGWNEAQIRRFEAARGLGRSMGAQTPYGQFLSLPYGEKVEIIEANRRLTEALGDESAIRAHADFINIGNARAVVADVASALYFTDTPLTSDQVDQVVQILVDSRNTGPAAKTSAYDWSAIMAKTKDILSPAQREVFAARQADDLFKKALDRTSKPGGSTSTAAPANPKK